MRTELVAAALAICATLAYAWLRQQRRPRPAATPQRRRWPQGVEVRKSLIDNAGDGLFAVKLFAKGDVLGEYRGVVVSMMQRLKRDDDDTDYMMGAPRARLPSRVRDS